VQHLWYQRLTYGKQLGKEVVNVIVGGDLDSPLNQDGAGIEIHVHYFVAIKIIHSVSSGGSSSTEILVLTSRYYCIRFDISLQAFSYLE